MFIGHFKKPYIDLHHFYIGNFLMKKGKNGIKVTFWGVRGSIATPGKDFIKYGGNTSCVELRCGDTILIFDAGTGMRELGKSLIKEFGSTSITVNLLISHTHWDHIQGFPFLDIAYIKGNRINLYGGHSVTNLKKLLLGQMDREYFPVTLLELAAEINFIELKENPFFIDDVKVYYTHLFHPALALGYRVEYKDKVFVYVTDNEILNDPDMENYNKGNIGNLIKNADVLIIDCQYTNEEYQSKIGWGHSSIDVVVRICNEFSVKNVFTFHHDPIHSDHDIDKMIKHAREIARKPLKVYAAREKTSVYM